MRKIALLVIVLLVFAIAIIGSRDKKERATYKIYSDPEGVFTIQYPEDFKISGRGKDNVVLATVATPKNYLSGTNFSDGKLTIDWSNNPDEIANCLGLTISEEVAAGNLYETKMYKKVYDGDCHTFTYTLHSTKIANYDPNAGIEEFDKELVQDQFEKIIRSFKFLVNSN